MHPCTGRSCHHYGKVWLTSEHFKYSIKKRCKTCNEKREHNLTHCNAEVKERKRKLLEEHELETIPEHDLSPEGKAAAYASALRSLQAELAHANQQYPRRMLSCNFNRSYREP